MKKKRFFGIYYKHQNVDGYTLAVISSTSNEGDMIQVITNEKSYLIKDISSVDIAFKGIKFDVHQEDISLTGYIDYGELLVPKKDIMSYYRFLPIECKHKIYSMYQSLSGEITLNNKVISFNNGSGYIEGDRGVNFPKEYLWINAINSDASITLAIATIPFKLFVIKGITTLITYKNKEYRFGTYNGAKILKLSKENIVIKKGKYLLSIDVPPNSGHPLKAPIKGDMIRYIHECPSSNIHYVLKHKERVIMDITHPYASIEYMFKD